MLFIFKYYQINVFFKKVGPFGWEKSGRPPSNHLGGGRLALVRPNKYLDSK